MRFSEYFKRTRCKSKSNTRWDLKFWLALSNSSLLIQRLLRIRCKFSIAKWSCWSTLKCIALGGFRSRWFVWNITRDEMLKLVHYWLIVRANWFSMMCFVSMQFWQGGSRGWRSSAIDARASELLGLCLCWWVDKFSRTWPCRWSLVSFYLDI